MFGNRYFGARYFGHRYFGPTVIVSPTTPGGGGVGGARYRYFQYLPYDDCHKKARQLEAKRRRIAKKIAVVESEIQDKERQEAHQFNLIKLKQLHKQLALMAEHLNELHRMLQDIEDEEMLLIIMCLPR